MNPTQSVAALRTEAALSQTCQVFLQIHKSNGIWTFLYVACILCMNKIFGFKIFLVYAFVQVSIKSTCRIELTKLAYLVALGFRLRVHLILSTLLGLIEQDKAGNEVRDLLLILIFKLDVHGCRLEM